MQKFDKWQDFIRDKKKIEILLEWRINVRMLIDYLCTTLKIEHL